MAGKRNQLPHIDFVAADLSPPLAPFILSFILVGTSQL